MIRGSRARIRAISQLERHETPDPVRSGAVESRFHGVRQPTVVDDQLTLSARTAGLVPVARVAEHDLVPGRHRGPPTARCLPGLARRLLARSLRLSWRS